MGYIRRVQLILVFYFFCFISDVKSVKKCSETFCRRVRQSPTNYPRYYLDTDAIHVSPRGIDGSLVTNTQRLRLQLTLYADRIFRLSVYNNKSNIRLQKPEVLLDLPTVTTPWSVSKRTTNSVTVENGNTSAVLFGKPFKIEFYSHGSLISVANPQDRLVFETGSQGRAVAIDVSFPGAQRAYGIPQHAENLGLRTTTIDNRDPYRLYNLDYGRNKPAPTDALYGSVPVLYAHSIKQSSGVFWSNTAETWVDITVAPNQVDAFFMSETGFFDLIVYTGPTLSEAIKQFASSTGTAPLPQLFSLGYHQSRNSYMAEEEVLEVVEEFDKNELPLDSVWLGVNYTENNKYFTWNLTRFPDPIRLQRTLNDTSRKLILVINPHFKTQTGYFVHDNATRNKYYIKDRYNSYDYVGKSLAGDSSWMDFKNYDARQYYKSLFSLDTFKSKTVHIWNDMNEPSVFNNPSYENTFSSDLLHVGGWQHGDVHNVYGYEQTLSTFQGLIDRFGSEQNAVRPFLLTRSFYAGSQRFAAIYTGENYGRWEDLELSIPMCLTAALAGISLCGANVGGFAGIPDDELYQRWYQVGSWLPFFRAHSAEDVPRREPYLYSDGVKSRIRAALNQRYVHLPVWYTLFWEHARYGEAVIRPLTYQYPNEEDALDIDSQFLVGSDILVVPVLQKRTAMISVYLPGGRNETWFDVRNNLTYSGTGLVSTFVTLDTIPVFYRGGSILVRKDRLRPSTAAKKYDNLSLYICLDVNNKATGTFYEDDYETYRYKLQKEYIYLRFNFINNKLSSYKIDENASYGNASHIEKIVILNPPKNVVTVRLNGINAKKEEAKIAYDESGILTVSNFLLNVQKAFTVELL